MDGLADKQTGKPSSPSIAPASLSDVLGTTAGFHSGASSGLSSLTKALVKAQAELKNANLNKVNPHFKSKYADLAEIRDTVMPVLSKHGIALVQYTQIGSAGFYLVTRLMHESGEMIESRFPLPDNVEKPQQMGSAITYARRYTMAAICGITAEEDDDGNAAQVTNGGGSSGGGKTTSRPKPSTHAANNDGGVLL